MMWAHELAEAEKSLKQDFEWVRQMDGRQKRLVIAQAYYNRINKTREEQEALVECLPMARALFGSDLEEALKELRSQFWIVQVNVDSYIDDEGVNDIEFTKKIRRAMYYIQPVTGETNEISQAISESVAKIETVCEPALRLETTKQNRRKH